MPIKERDDMAGEYKNLDREEKKLGKIADKNTKMLRHTKTIALNKFK